MPKISLTIDQVYLLADIVEEEVLTERKYGDGDQSILNKKCRLRNALYRELKKKGNIV